MRKIFGVSGLIAIVALLALGPGTSSRAVVTYDKAVSPDGLTCQTTGVTPTYTTITSALSAADPDDIIFVCAGTYTESNLNVNVANLSLLGPGSTPENDGEAILKLQTAHSTNLLVSSDGVTISGLTLNATPNAGTNTTGIATNTAQTITITHNIITGATSNGIFISQPSGTGPYTITDNTIDSTFRGMHCTCPNATISSNHVSSPASYIGGIDATGSGIEISGNTLANANISIFGNNGVISNNMVDGTGADTNLIEVLGGDPVAVTGNELSNITQTAIVLAENALPINASITKNTITNARYGIQILDFPDKPAPLTALIGGSPANANVFVNSGSASGESGRLLTITFGTENYNAEFNNWGLCTLAEIEDQVYHHTDVPSLGTVDFDPFIKPAGCPSTTPSPSPSPTSSPTPSPTLSPSPSPSPTASPPGQLIWGDIDCSGILTAIDALKLMLGSLSLLYDKPQSCPSLGQEVVIAADQRWGDINCSGAPNAIDAVDVLATLAGTPKTPDSGCPAVGDPISLAVS